MQNVESTWTESTVRETYSDAAVAKAMSKYSFGFKIDGVAYHCGYDPQESKLYIEGPATRAELLDLIEKVEAIFRESKLGVDDLDARKFLCKHLRAMMKVKEELRRAPLSERNYEVLDSKPIDMTGLSLEEQCILEVIQEQREKANQVAIGNGTPDDVTHTITVEMVEAKMKEKMQ